MKYIIFLISLIVAFILCESLLRVSNAIKLIEYCKAMGAYVLKFQTHISEAETLRNAPMPPAFKGEPRYEYFERTAFDESKWKEIKDKCDLEGIEFMSSPFSIEAVDLL